MINPHKGPNKPLWVFVRVVCNSYNGKHEFIVKNFFK